MFFRLSSNLDSLGANVVSVDGFHQQHFPAVLFVDQEEINALPAPGSFAAGRENATLVRFILNHIEAGAVEIQFEYQTHNFHFLGYDLQVAVLIVTVSVTASPVKLRSFISSSVLEPHLMFALRDSFFTCANASMIDIISSLLASDVSMFFVSKMTSTPASFRIRRAISVSSVFLPNRKMLLVIMASTFLLWQSASILWNSPQPSRPVCDVLGKVRNMTGQTGQLFLTACADAG